MLMLPTSSQRCVRRSFDPRISRSAEGSEIEPEVGDNRNGSVLTHGRRRSSDYLRRLLYDESRSIDEVHCSNIEGQVWSRGSRQSVEAAVEYVNEKAEDAIIPEDLRDEIARLIREFTTRR